MKCLKCVKKRFTLTELIVAMAVFSIMITILIDFFVGSQKLWSGTENKNDLYTDARIAMDLFSNTLQSQYYDGGEGGTTMFLFGTASGNTDAVYFPVKMPIDYGTKEDIYYMGLQWRKDDACLYMRASANNAMFAVNNTDLSKKRSFLRTNLSYSSADSQKVIDGIVSLSFKPVYVNFAYPGNASNSSPSLWIGTPSDTNLNIGTVIPDTTVISPVGVQISMQMMSKQSWNQWKRLGGVWSSGQISSESDAAKDYRLANTHQFDRIIYLGFK